MFVVVCYWGSWVTWTLPPFWILPPWLSVIIQGFPNSEHGFLGSHKSYSRELTKNLPPDTMNRTVALMRSGQWSMRSGELSKELENIWEPLVYAHLCQCWKGDWESANSSNSPFQAENTFKFYNSLSKPALPNQTDSGNQSWIPSPSEYPPITLFNSWPALYALRWFVWLKHYGCEENASKNKNCSTTGQLREG